MAGGPNFTGDDQIPRRSAAADPSPALHDGHVAIGRNDVHLVGQHRHLIGRFDDARLSLAHGLLAPSPPQFAALDLKVVRRAVDEVRAGFPAGLLVDVHGQLEFQSLSRRGYQRELLDGSGSLENQTAAVRDAYRAWRALEQKRAEIEERIKNLSKP